MVGEVGAAVGMVGDCAKMAPAIGVPGLASVTRYSGGTRNC